MILLFKLWSCKNYSSYYCQLFQHTDIIPILTTSPFSGPRGVFNQTSLINIKNVDTKASNKSDHVTHDMFRWKRRVPKKEKDNFFIPTKVDVVEVCKNGSNKSLISYKARKWTQRKPKYPWRGREVFIIFLLSFLFCWFVCLRTCTCSSYWALGYIWLQLKKKEKREEFFNNEVL